MKKFNAGTVLAGMIAVALLATGCENPAGKDPAGSDPVYAISLGESGSYAFPEVYVGYGAQEAKTVTVTNTGDHATGALAIAKSGVNAASFTVSKANISDIAAGGTDTFTVAPNRGLAAGTYTATITVSGDHDISASFTVRFEVTVRPSYSIGLSNTGNYVFPAATVGYASAPAAYAVTVTNRGSQATGALTIEKSGANTASFTVSKTSISDIAVGETDTFTVQPNVELEIGTHTTTITVSGGNDISASFTVNFTVNPTTPAYSIASTETGTHVFPGATAGYGGQTAVNVTITNTGNRATGALTLAKSGANAAGFVVSKTSISDIVVDGTDTFTVVPDTGLAAGTYTATITVRGGNGINASFNVSFAVAVAPVYSIRLTDTGTYTFPDDYVGYGAQAARTVSIINEGNQTTGALTVEKSGTGASSFALSAATIGDIAIGRNDTFTVVPNTGLAAGTYAATITVRGGNGISANFTVSFTVTPSPSYGVTVRGGYSSVTAVDGYAAPLPRTVVVKNVGLNPTGALTVALSGTSAADFTLSTTSIGSIAAGDNDTFTVTPNTGLAVGSHTATVTVSGGSGDSAISVTAWQSFTVEAKTWGVRLSESGTYAFPGAIFGDTPQAATVTIANTKNQDTGALTVALSGTNATSFTLSSTTIGDIAVNRNDSFTVTPNTGLSVGPYAATVTVSGANGISASFDVSFTVIAETHTIALSETAYTFPGTVNGYGSQEARARTVRVTNTGNRTTGALTVALSGISPDSFALSAAAIGDIAVGRYGSFTVAPVTGLPAGTRTATVTVSGSYGISESFGVSFTVNPGYTVIFDADGGTPAITTAQTSYGNNRVSLPANPVKEGYAFGGWRTAANSVFNENTAVTADTTVHARWISANANLAALSVSPGSLDQTFNPVITNYTVTAPNSTASIAVNAWPVAVGARYEQSPSNNPVSLNVGPNIITVKVVAEDGSEKNYQITVTRAPLSNNANLGSLEVIGGTLSPAFSANTTAYTALVSASSVILAATVSDTKATLAQSPANPVSLSASPRIINITVTGEDRTTKKTYTITVSKAQADKTIDVVIGMADERIDLIRSTENDLSKEAGSALRLTASAGYSYTWLVDLAAPVEGSNTSQEITLYASNYAIGTHSVLLEYVKDGEHYGCEVLFRVSR
jgi:uncharacterized membrane protein